jgi:hypothetical protein
VTGLADGGWIVAWHSNTAVGIGYDIYQQRYTAGGAKSGGETPVNTIRDGG